MFCILLLPIFLNFFLGTSQEIGWEVCPRNDLFCIEWDVMLLLNQSIMPLFSMLSFHPWSLLIRSSSFSAITTLSSAYSHKKGKIFPNWVKHFEFLEVHTPTYEHLKVKFGVELLMYVFHAKLNCDLYNVLPFWSEKPKILPLSMQCWCFFCEESWVMVKKLYACVCVYVCLSDNFTLPMMRWTVHGTLWQCKLRTSHRCARLCDKCSESEQRSLWNQPRKASRSDAVTDCNGSENTADFWKTTTSI